MTSNSPLVAPSHGPPKQADGKPSYISPTSFMLWRENPVGFWMRYLAPPEIKPPRPPQTPQMAVGNVFDTHIKYHLASTVGRRDLSSTMLEDGIESRMLGRKGSLDKYDQLVLWEGLRAYHAYKESPAMRTLLQNLTNIEITPADKVHIVNGVPIWGKLDLELFANGRRIVTDWKTSGAFNSGKTSVEAGYSYRYVQRMEEGRSIWIDEGPHARAIEPLEILSERWAIQIAMYAWMMGDGPGSEINGRIDKILLVDSDTVEVYVYRCHVGRDFQLRLLSELKLMWEKIMANEILPPELRGAPPALLMAMVDP